MAIRGLLFDKDGTLFDYAATWTPVNRQVALAAAGGDAALARRLLALGGHDPDSDRVAAGSPLAAGHTAEIARLWAPLLGAADLAALAALIDAVFIEGGIAQAVPVTDLPALFARLRRRGLALGVATNDSEAGARGALARFGLLELVDFYAGYDSGHGAKPGPGMVAAFCRALGLAAGEVAVVGDNLHDLAMARTGGAGLGIGVLTGNADRATLAPHADAVLESITELEAFLAAIPVGREA